MSRTGARGRLIAVEGIDGAGKSTFVRSLARALRRRGCVVTVRREPADPTLGALAQTAGAQDPWTGAIYFTLDRHLARPALERDLRRSDLVLTDRSFHSTLAYQGSALAGRDRRRLENLQRSATVPPDRVLLLDLTPAEAFRRLGHRGRVRGPLERRRLLERVARRYRGMARDARWVTLDARRPTADLVREAVRALGPVARRARSLRRPERT
jgi:dTMP kinase